MVWIVIAIVRHCLINRPSSCCEFCSECSYRGLTYWNWTNLLKVITVITVFTTVARTVPNGSNKDLHHVKICTRGGIRQHESYVRGVAYLLWVKVQSDTFRLKLFGNQTYNRTRTWYGLVSPLGAGRSWASQIVEACKCSNGVGFCSYHSAPSLQPSQQLLCSYRELRYWNSTTFLTVTTAMTVFTTGARAVAMTVPNCSY